MATRAEARLLSMILRIGLLLAILAQIGWSFRPTPSGAQTDLEARGRALYEANCSTCHTGPRLTDDSFHNTGVPAVPGLPEDLGRETGAKGFIGNAKRGYGQTQTHTKGESMHERRNRGRESIGRQIL